MVIETIAGSLLGGVFRMVPEVLNYFDRKHARKHELAMEDKALAFEQLRGDQQLAQANVQNQMVLDTGGLAALKEGIAAQGKSTGIPWVDALNSLVRPTLTFWWCIILFTAVKACQYLVHTKAGVDAGQALLFLWGPWEQSVVGGIINFWFLDRVIRKNKGL